MLNFKQLLEYKLKIKNNLEQGLIDESENLIRQYEQLNPYDLELCSIKATMYFMKEDFNSAKQELLKGYESFEFNFDINYNLAIVHIYNKEYQESVYYFLRCVLIKPSCSNDVLEQIKSLLANNYITIDDFNEAKKAFSKVELNFNKQFPLKDNELLYMGDFLFKNKNHGYVSGYYDYYYPERDGLLWDINKDQLALSTLFKTEILPGIKTKISSFKTSLKTVMPIMTLNANDTVELTINSVSHTLKNLLPKRFYYYPLDENTEVNLTCTNDFILGDLIPLDYTKEKPKVVLNLFIDGLSQKFLEDNNLEECMPNTYKFFKEGTICNNCYVSGEWTYVSLASFFTGEYTSNHMVYHPNHGTDRLYNKELYHQILNKNGYFTTKIDGDWRSTPASGYAKGFDRYIYQPSIRGMHCDDIIKETIEHLESFKEKNNFIWVCIPDLHDIADEYETRLSTQINTNTEYRIFEKNSETSVRKPFDNKKIYRYKVQLKRIDTYLGLLLDYLNENYSNNEMLISLIADHGQGYMVKSDNFLDEERIKVPMMFKGKNIPKGNSSELIQSLDLFPIILNTCAIKKFDIKDGNIPKYFGGLQERTYTYSETIFPGSPYRATINDKTHKFFFETKDNCDVDGRFKAFDYTIKLINKDTTKDDLEKYPDKVNTYLDIIFDHIKKHMIIE